MVRRYTILLLIPHLGGGGAERVMAHLARSLPRNRFAVHLGVIARGIGSGEELPSHAQVHELNAGRVLFGAVGLVRMVRKINPDLILSGMFHLNFLVLLLRPLFPPSTRILVRQNGTLSAWPEHAPRLGRFLYRLIYPRADAIVGQTGAMANDLNECLGPKARVHVLANPVDVQDIRRAADKECTRWTGSGPHLLAVGRLSPEKGFDLLLEAFATVRIRHPEADLAILGEGAERRSLETKSKFLGVDSSVRFPGYVSEPPSWFAGATLLVIPSRCDALPNVLLEGAGAGLPIVATPCSDGLTELIHGQAGTWLAREVSSEALAESLDAALTTLRPGERFAHSFLAPFHLSEAVGGYERLILETLTGVPE